MRCVHNPGLSETKDCPARLPVTLLVGSDPLRQIFVPNNHNRPKDGDPWGPEYFKNAIQRSIRLIPENTVVNQLRKLSDHCDCLVEANGIYISQID